MEPDDGIPEELRRHHVSYWIIPKALVPFRYPGVNLGPYGQISEVEKAWEQLSEDDRQNKVVVEVTATFHQLWP